MSEEQDVESPSFKNSQDLATLTEVKKYLQKALKRITILKSNSISSCDLSEVQTESEYELNLSRDKTDVLKSSNDVGNESSRIVNNNISSSNEGNSASNGLSENPSTNKVAIPQLERGKAKKNTTEESSPSLLGTLAQIKVEAPSSEVDLGPLTNSQPPPLSNPLPPCPRLNKADSSDSSSDSEGDVEFVKELTTHIDNNIIKLSDDNQEDVDMKLFVFQYRALLKLRKKSTCQSVRLLLDDVGIRNIVDVVVVSGNHCDLAIVTFSDEASLKIALEWNQNLMDDGVPVTITPLSQAQLKSIQEFDTPLEEPKSAKRVRTSSFHKNKGKSKRSYSGNAKKKF